MSYLMRRSPSLGIQAKVEAGTNRNNPERELKFGVLIETTTTSFDHAFGNSVATGVV